jgi:hypothetical protein
VSKEARIGLWAAIIMFAMGILFDPKQPLFRSAIWIVFDAGVILAVTDLGFLHTQQFIIDIFGEHLESRHLSQFRLSIAAVLISSLMLVAAIKTWPPQQLPGNSTPLALQPPIPPPFRLPMTIVPSDPKALPRPKTKVVPPAFGKRGPNQESKGDSSKAKAITPVYPIVLVTDTKVTYDKDSGKVTVVLSIGNSTQTEANAHIQIHGVGFQNGSAITSELNKGDEEVGLAPPPYKKALTMNFNVSQEARPGWDDGTTYMMIYVTVAYPDRSGTTTYHFEAKTMPTSDTLNELSSGWDGPK